jgi:hypothetical protein
MGSISGILGDMVQILGLNLDCNLPQTSYLASRGGQILSETSSYLKEKVYFHMGT